MKSRWMLPTVFAALTLVSCARNQLNNHGPAFGSTPGSEDRSLSADISAGRALFLKNCAHCHGADATGNEGPDLHGLDWTDDQITTRIRNGKKGQMAAFGEKFSPEQFREIVAYVKTLK